ncbi:hypothetical protein AB0I72_21245 [Nocardiopsis sp. NPDC049922]|uniref:hypothetical protein n=1 Tax=Nocardiopsis sp. NPDC049922 TaxID=3155157 RepID=UPI0033D502D0
MRLKHVFLAAGAAAVTLFGASPALADDGAPPVPSPAQSDAPSPEPSEAPSPAQSEAPEESPEPSNPDLDDDELEECWAEVLDLAEAIGLQEDDFEIESMEDCSELLRDLEEEVAWHEEQESAAAAGAANPLPVNPNYTG